MDPDDAYKACLKQKTNLQRLVLSSKQLLMEDYSRQVNTELEQAVLDGLEPPHGIKKLEIDGYSGRKYAQWMLTTEVGGGVLGPARFPFLKMMTLSSLPNLQHLNGLVELPCLENLHVKLMPSLESIIGGPFPSLVQLTMFYLPSLGEVQMLGENMNITPEEGRGYNNCTPVLGQVQIGDCLTDLDITNYPKVKVKLYLPSSLQRLSLSGCSAHLLQSPGECEGSCSSSRFSQLKKLELERMTGLECGGGWELLQYLTALESLEIKSSNPSELPKSIGQLRSLQELTIQDCSSLSSLPQSMGRLTFLQSLVLKYCQELEQLPDCMGELCSLRRLKITDLPGLTCLPRSICDLASLEELEIGGCPGIASFPEGMSSLVSLTELWINNCRGLTSLPQEMKGLQKLRIWCCPGIKSLPEGMNSFVSLEELDIKLCSGLTSLPQEMTGLVSLEKLTIWDCPGIKSLPEGIKGLTALKKLEIYDCPDPVRRCERGMGEDWHLISHIPHLWIRLATACSPFIW